MCGIIGSVGKIPTEKEIKAACDLLAHRGPNDEGLYYAASEGVALGHRRLSIIDLSPAGHQPLFDQSGRYAAIFNGEIYNYLELREELSADYRFKTKTDTEVLLASYIKWGKAAPRKFNGMFAFAIWDKVKKELFLARDRAGVKPLFFTWQNGTLYFASEIKALLPFMKEIRPNRAIIYDYLAFGLYDHTEETFFEDIERFPAGYSGFVREGKLELSQYWDLGKVIPFPENVSDDQIERKYKTLLADSIKLRFRSDVPVGITLSSGLDSNSIHYFARQVVNSDFELFTMCSKVEDYDECEILTGVLTADEKKHWHTCYPDLENVAALAEEMNETQDQPYGGIPTLAYAKIHETAAAAGITVLLEGEGGDELLGGYKYYLSAEKNKNSFSQDMSLATDALILNPSFLKEHEGRKAQFEAPFDSNFRNLQYRDFKYTKLPRVMRFNDHASMSYGRELRFPYLDYRLVEFCFALPERFKIRNRAQKYLARKSMAGVAPDAILNAPKKFFGALQIELLRGSLKEWAKSIIESESFRSRGFWNYEMLDEKVEAFFRGEGDNSFFLWQCINLELWFRKFINQF